MEDYFGNERVSFLRRINNQSYHIVGIVHNAGKTFSLRANPTNEKKHALSFDMVYRSDEDKKRIGIANVATLEISLSNSDYPVMIWDYDGEGVRTVYCGTNPDQVEVSKKVIKNIINSLLEHKKEIELDKSLEKRVKRIL